MLTELVLSLVLMAPIPKDRMPDTYAVGVKFQWYSMIVTIDSYDPIKQVYMLRSFNFPAYEPFPIHIDVVNRMIEEQNKK